MIAATVIANGYVSRVVVHIPKQQRRIQARDSVRNKQSADSLGRLASYQGSTWERGNEAAAIATRGQKEFPEARYAIRQCSKRPP